MNNKKRSTKTKKKKSLQKNKKSIIRYKKNKSKVLRKKKFDGMDNIPGGEPVVAPILNINEINDWQNLDDDKIKIIFDNLTNNVNHQLIIVNNSNVTLYRFYHTFFDILDDHYRFSGIYKFYQDSDERNGELFVGIRYYERNLDENSENSQDASEEYTRELNEIKYSKQGDIMYLKEH
jgi:hypothetical protein